MDRRASRILVFGVLSSVLITGCSPQQPFFVNEDGDLSHLLTDYTRLDFPDVESADLPDAHKAHAPKSLLSEDRGEFWDLTLEEAISIALNNSKVIRSVGQVRQFRQVGQGVSTPPESLSINSDFAPTIYDPAIQESGQQGVAAALSAFDAQWTTNMFWDRTDRPQNVTEEGGGTQIFARRLQRDNMNFQSELTKRAANGTQLSWRNVTTYDSNNRPLRETTSEWLTSFEAEMRHPLLRGSGTLVNRIPVVLARIRTDVALVDFMGNVRNLLSEVEKSYWELYFFYRNLSAAKIGRDSALLTWRRINALFQEGAQQGDAASKAQAQEQYFFFRGRTEEAKRDLLKAERQLRYLLGLSPTDGRTIRPKSEPTEARVEFEWHDILAECLTRSGEVMRQKWNVKVQELGLKAAKNNLLPQFDIVALYRWLGLGDDLWSTSKSGRPEFPFDGSQALGELTGGESQEWRLGFEFSMPLGLRAEHSQVRNQQLILAREKAKLEDLELELSHSLTDAVQNLDANYRLMNTALMQVQSARLQVEALQAQLDAGSVTLDFLLDAQRRLADAEVAYYQSLIQYNFSIIEVHFRKGSLLEYCGVTLAEGPWPAKAYFDATIRARQRDASYYFNYGYTRPGVVSRGPMSGKDALSEPFEIVEESELAPVPESDEDHSDPNDDREASPTLPLEKLEDSLQGVVHATLTESNQTQASTLTTKSDTSKEESFDWGDL